MRSRLLVLLVLVFMTCVPVAAVEASNADTLTHPEAGPPGIYVFYDWSRVDPKKYPIVGGEMIFTWNKIEYASGKYNWGDVDKFIADMTAQGKRAGLRINAYDGQCCGGSSVPGFHKTATPKIVLSCNGVEIPRYWDTSYKNAFSKMINAFGARYDKDARVAWVEISAGIFGETAPAEDDYDTCMQNAGLTSEMWINTVNWATDLYRNAFPTKQLFLQYAPRYLERSERRKFTDYAAGKGVGLKHNGLKPDGTADAFITDPDNSAYKAGQYDPLVTWGDQVTLAFEGSNVEVSMEGRANTMWSIYNAIDKRSDFLMLDTAVTTAADRQDLLQFAAKYLGKKLPDIPSAWVALRETEFDWFPDYGNYEYYLFQNDAAPGGKTVPLFKVDSTAEGRYSRRTNQGGGSPNMYFDLDDNYAYGGIYKAIFTVTYLDRGTDKWELRYDATTANDKLAGAVTKKNTNKWVKATFQVTDADFANSQPGGGSRMGSDFRIAGLNDGDETIHMVDVVATPAQPKKLRLQPGVEGYNGLRDTYLTSWSTDKNTGAEDRLWVGYPDKMFGLLRFDLSALPQGSKIVTATLGVHHFGGSLSYAVNLNLAAHRLLRDWDEGGATWNKAKSSVAWQQPGAMGPNDRESTSSGSVDLYQTSGWARINITSLVQTWSDTPSANLGLLLKGTTDRNAQFYFNSAQATDAALRPYLEIEYYEQIKPPPTVTPSITPTKTATPKPGTVTPTPTPSRTPTRTLTPTASPTMAPTATFTPSPTATAVPGLRSLTSRYTASQPSIDGNLSEWTQPELIQVKTGTADTITFQANPSATDLSADVRSFWDAEYLYLVAAVTDDKIYQDSSQVWHDDSVEFGIDAANDQIASQPDDHQFTVTANGRLTDFGSEISPEARAGFKMATQQRSGGYDIELAIPRSYLAAGAFVEGKVLGFTIGLNDDDDGGNRESNIDNHMIWEGASTNSAPQNFGKLALGALYSFGVTPTATPSQTPTFTVTATQMDTPTATLTPPATFTPTLTPPATFTPTATHSPTATWTPTATLTVTPIPIGHISGQVWLDRNGNGRQDGNEPGIAGIQLSLARQLTPAGEPSDIVLTAVTGPGGRFEFSALPFGRYVLAVLDLPNLLTTTQRKVTVDIHSESPSFDTGFGVRSLDHTRLYLPFVLR